MSVILVAKLATFLLFASTNAATPSYEERHLVRERPLASRNPSAYRLPATTVPSNYKINLRIDPDYHESFSGHVEIDITAIINTREIFLHAHPDMEFGNITVIRTNGSDDIYGALIHSDTDNHFFMLSLRGFINAGDEAKVRIEFVGKYGDEEGLYLSSYKNQQNITRYLATTQFQAVSAREAFPCYDEPHLMATFSLVIYHPKKFHAISNMEEDTSRDLPDINDFKGTKFKTTPLMSTYLIAFIVSDFISKSNNETQIFPQKKFRVFARPTAADLLDYPLDFAQRSLLDLEKYTNLSYILPKMDKAAVPDFSAGAMENWGLVTYREEYLLHKNGITSTSDEQLIAAVISHENAHMWFGNEVTPSWWSYLWLSEGFATYFEYYTTDNVLNFKFRMMEQFVVTYMQGVMRSDATTSTNAMTNDVGSPSEIDNNFNGIAYDKSGSVIRMIQHIMGKEAFQLGLQNYVKNMTLQVTEPIKLFRQLENVANSMPSDIKLTGVFHSWSSQKGFPVVSALHRNDRRYVEFYQTRYYQQSIISNEQWYIPLTWAFEGDANFENTTVQNWLEPGSNLTIDLNEVQQWFIVNKQQMGYFRVMYDKTNWISLSEALHREDFDGIHHLNRAQLIDDAYAFATSLRLSFNVTMDLLSYLPNEDDFIPWITAERLINNMDILMVASANNDRYKRFTTSLSKNTYDKFGIDAKVGDSSIDKLHREIALSLQCNAGISNARGLANNKIAQIVKNPNFKIDPDLRSTVYCCGLRSSSEEEWDAIFEKYIEAPRPTEKYMVLRTLGCTENKLIADRYLNMSISDDSRVDDEDRFRVVVAMINGGGLGLIYAMDFLFDEFPKFQSMTADVSGGVRVISALQNRIVGETHTNQFVEFRTKYYSIFTFTEQSAITRAVDVIRDRNLLLYTALTEIDPWLIDNVSDGSGTLASVSKLLITICAMCLIYL